MAFGAWVGVFLFLSLALGQDSMIYDPKNHFIWPPSEGANWANDANALADNVAITYGIPVQRPFSWVSTATAVSVRMWQLGSGLKSKQIMTCVPNNPLNETTSAWWDGDIGAIDPKVQHVVFLILTECNSSAPKFYSHYFNLTSPADAASSASTAAPSSSSTSTTATSPGSLGQSTGLTSPAPTPAAAAAAGPSDAAVLAAGIGGGVGGAIVLVALAFAGWRWRRSRRMKQRYMAAVPDYHPSPTDGGGSEKYGSPSEVDGATSFPFMIGSSDVYPARHVHEMGGSHEQGQK